MEFFMPQNGRARKRSLARLMATVLCAASVLTVPAIAGSPAATLADAPDPPAPALAPIDPQVVRQAYDLTWSDYHADPQANWADPSIVPSIKKWKVALVLTDFDDQPFEVTLPQGSTIWQGAMAGTPFYANPGPAEHDLARADVPAYYRDLLNTPSALNHYQTMNGYWMEDSHGEYGVQLDAYGPYRMPGHRGQYFLTEYSSTAFCADQTMVSSTATNVTSVPVVDSSRFYVGDTVGMSPTSAGWSGTKYVMAIPDATHIGINNTTLSAATFAGDTLARLASVAGVHVGNSITIDVPLASPTSVSDTATIAAVGAGTGSTTVGLAAAAGDTNIKVASVSGFAAGNTVWIDASPNIETAVIASVGTAGATTVRTATAAGATVIPVASSAGFSAGQTITIGAGASQETAVVTSTSGGGSATITVSAPLTVAHAVGAPVSGSGITLAAGLASAHAGGAAVSGSGVAFAAPLASDHASGMPVYDGAATGVNLTATSTTLAAAVAAGATNIKVASVSGLALGQTITIDSGGSAETAVISGPVNSSNAFNGTAGATGTGLNVTTALAFAHASGASVTGLGFVNDCNKNFRNDSLAYWRADQGATINTLYDNYFYVSAGEDESSTWQEFGEMMFQTQNDVSDAFGNPNPALPNWAPTRYIPWTSYQAAINIWPSASGNNSIEAESSGMGTYAHELTHNLGILDNYNNQFATPPQRAAAGYWSMMSSGNFLGPGGNHTRWQVPAVNGGSLGGQHMLRDKVKLGFTTLNEELRLNRDGLAASGLAVADVTAREVDPGTGLSGIDIKLDGASPQDHNPTCSYTTDPLCSGTPNFNDYTIEVSQNIGDDSFQADHGVIITKTKTSENSSCGSYSCFAWIIDAHPEDINIVDFYRPDGTPVMIPISHNMQLADALFHAGTNSGSQYEWEDTYNSLHFYILDKYTDAIGILHYIVGVQNPTGAGPQTRGVAVENAGRQAVADNYAWCSFTLDNTGLAAPTDPALHPQDANAYLNNDIYRLSTDVVGEGWHAELPNALASAPFGGSTTAGVYVTRDVDAAAPGAAVTLTATSVSDPTKSATGSCALADVPTSTTVTSSANPSAYGHAATFTATVSAVPAAGIPSGEVTFSLDGSPVGAPVALDAAGLASWTAPADLPLGTHLIEAAYAGAGPAGAGFAPSAGSLDQVVKKRLATSTLVSSDLNPSPFGTLVTFSATVSPENDSLGTIPTGFVQWKVDGVAVGGPVALDASGMAGMASASLTAGHRAVRAVYLGSPAYGGSTSPTYLQTVRKVLPSGTVVSDPAGPLAYGSKPITLTASFVNPIAPAGSLAPGEVQFLIDGTALGAPSTIAADGSAVFTVNWNLPAGHHTIRARYLGNADFLPATSPGLSLTITAPNT